MHQPLSSCCASSSAFLLRCWNPRTCQKPNRNRCPRCRIAGVFFSSSCLWPSPIYIHTKQEAVLNENRKTARLRFTRRHIFLKTYKFIDTYKSIKDVVIVSANNLYYYIKCWKTRSCNCIYRRRHEKIF